MDPPLRVAAPKGQPSSKPVARGRTHAADFVVLPRVREMAEKPLLVEPRLLEINALQADILKQKETIERISTELNTRQATLKRSQTTLKKMTQELESAVVKKVTEVQELLALAEPLAPKAEHISALKQEIVDFRTRSTHVSEAYMAIAACSEQMIEDVKNTTQEQNEAVLAYEAASLGISFLNRALDIPIRVQLALEKSAPLNHDVSQLTVAVYEHVIPDAYKQWKEGLEGCQKTRAELLSTTPEDEVSRVHRGLLALQNPPKELPASFFALCDENQKSTVENEQFEKGITYVSWGERIHAKTSASWNTFLQRLSVLEVKLKIIGDFVASYALYKKLFSDANNLFLDLQTYRRDFRDKWNKKLDKEERYTTLNTSFQDQIQKFKTALEEWKGLQKSFTLNKWYYERKEEAFTSPQFLEQSLQPYALEIPGLMEKTQEDLKKLFGQHNIEFIECRNRMNTFNEAVKAKLTACALCLDMHEWVINDKEKDSGFPWTQTSYALLYKTGTYRTLLAQVEADILKECAALLKELQEKELKEKEGKEVK